MRDADSTFFAPARVGSGIHVAIGTSAWAAALVLGIMSGTFETKIIADDAFYYFEIARNAAQGLGFSFDSMEPTNGFHPLWAVLLIPLYVVVPDDPWLPIKLAQALGVLCAAMTARTIERMFREANEPAAGEFAAFVFLLNPFTSLLCLRGMESPLATLAVVVSCAQLARHRATGAYRIRDAVSLGSGIGLCLLARTDAVLWAGTVGVFVLGDLLRAGRAGDVWSRGVAGVTGASLVFAPWAIWNLMTFGTLVQSSARAKMAFNLWGELPQPGAGYESWPSALLAFIVDGFRNLWLIVWQNATFLSGEAFERVPVVASRFVWLALIYSITSVLLMLVARRRVRIAGRVAAPGEPLLFMGPLVLLLGLHFAWYGWIMHSYSSWYFLLPIACLAILHGPWLRTIWHGFGARTTRIISLIPLAGLLVVSFWSLDRIRDSPLRASITLRIESLAAALPEGTTLGAWNAGTIGYVASFGAPKLRVVNLDGVVNQRVSLLRGAEAHTQYLLNEVDYLVEPPLYLARTMDLESARAFGREHLVTLPALRLWKIERDTKPREDRSRQPGRDPLRAGSQDGER